MQVFIGVLVERVVCGKVSGVELICLCRGGANAIYYLDGERVKEKRYRAGNLFI